MVIIEVLEKFWALFVAIATGIGTYINWRRKRRRSTLVLYDKLEELKLKIITQVSREIELVEEVAEKNKIISEFKSRCPDCYNQFVNDRK